MLLGSRRLRLLGRATIVAVVVTSALVFSGWGCTAMDVTAGGSTENIESDFPLDEDIVFTGTPDASVHAVCLGAVDGTACDDGDLCTVEDICIGGACIAGGPRSCTEEGACRQGTCDPTEGCVYEDVDDGRPCEVNCFGEAACVAGVCTEKPESEVVCPASDNECIDKYTCDRDTGECTIPEFRPADSVCNSDDNVCSLEYCDGKGTCQTSGAMDDCKTKQQANPCWTYSCTPKTGCVPTHFVEGLSCDDGNGCTLNDACAISSGLNGIGELDGSAYAVLYPEVEGVAVELDSSFSRLRVPQ